MQHSKQVPIIVLTGGPCAGKSTILSAMEQKLADLGVTVVTLAETATELILAGLNPQLLTREEFQRFLLRHTLAKEDLYHAAAARVGAEKVVLLCDRGIPDLKAYLEPHQYETLLAEQGCCEAEVRDGRYDAAIFLRSVAVDAPHLYTTENNPARYESCDQARAADARTLEAWVGHPHLRVVDNSTDLVGKRTQVMAAVCRVLGIPAPLEIERKFRVTNFDVSTIPMPVQPVEIVQYYLRPEVPGTVERVRTRHQAGGQTYYHTTKRTLRCGVREEVEYRITREEYLALLVRVDSSSSKIEKTRYCFVWKNQYFELDVIRRPVALMLLEHELTYEGEQTIMPDFLIGHVEDVTDDPAYQNAELARR